MRESSTSSLIERAKQVLSQDDRVLGVWLVGSYGRGTEDQFSDVDLWVVVAEDAVDGFCDDWPNTSDEIAPTVFQRAIGRRIFNQITPDWVRFDVSVSTPDAIGNRTRSTAKPLYDPNGLSAGLGEPGAPKQPDAGRVESITREFLRVLGLLPVVIGRAEFVVGQSGAGLLRALLIDLMLEDVAVEDRGGALHLDRLLPADRQQLLTNLPPLQATRESVIAAHVACATAFLPLARALHTRCALPWPQSLETAARQHLSTTLSVDLPE
ncbi:nucleotidyltransferase domain-containing protein [Kribbella sp. NPDC051952]|uniref:nucleotidyltransferase domain-containing protein n=1 Tax=Kribbella sp. NPDC051952 TaxID=3154851 RepID=UPI00343CB92B